MKPELISAEVYEAARRRLIDFRDFKSIDGIQSFADLFPAVQNVGSDLRTLAQIHGRHNDYEDMWESEGTVQRACVLGQEIPEVYYHFFTNRAISSIMIKDTSEMFQLARFHIPHKISQYNSGSYLNHTHYLPGFEAVKFQGEPQPPYPNEVTYPFDHFMPDVDPDDPNAQQNFAAVVQDCIGVVLDGIKGNSSSNVTKPRETKGLVDIAPYELYMIPRG